MVLKKRIVELRKNRNNSFIKKSTKCCWNKCLEVHYFCSHYENKMFKNQNIENEKWVNKRKRNKPKHRKWEDQPNKRKRNQRLGSPVNLRKKMQREIYITQLNRQIDKHSTWKSSSHFAFMVMSFSRISCATSGLQVAAKKFPVSFICVCLSRHSPKSCVGTGKGRNKIRKLYGIVVVIIF